MHSDRPPGDSQPPAQLPADVSPLISPGFGGACRAARTPPARFCLPLATLMPLPSAGPRDRATSPIRPRQSGNLISQAMAGNKPADDGPSSCRRDRANDPGKPRGGPKFQAGSRESEHRELLQNHPPAFPCSSCASSLSCVTCSSARASVGVSSSQSQDRCRLRNVFSGDRSRRSGSVRARLRAGRTAAFPVARRPDRRALGRESAGRYASLAAEPLWPRRPAEPQMSSIMRFRLA